MEVVAHDGVVVGLEGVEAAVGEAQVEALDPAPQGQGGLGRHLDRGLFRKQSRGGAGTGQARQGEGEGEGPEPPAPRSHAGASSDSLDRSLTPALPAIRSTVLSRRRFQRFARPFSHAGASSCSFR